MPDETVIYASTIPFNEALLRLAAIHHKTVTFAYAKGEGTTIEQRKLIPSDVKNVRGHVTFTGYDPDREAARAYRTDRIKGQVEVI